VNPSSRRWNYGREIAENLAESGDIKYLLVASNCKKMGESDNIGLFTGCSLYV